MATDSRNNSTNPNAAADPDQGIFGLPHSFDESRIIYVPVPWEVTTSYGSGTSYGPEAILKASAQLDLYDTDVKDPYLQGLHALPVSSEIYEMNKRARILAQTLIDAYGETGGSLELEKNLALVNEYSESLNGLVKKEISTIYESGKIPALIGGDHSTPFGAFQAAAEFNPSFGILHFDAHSDTRHAYLGFEHSHASIMYNASKKIPQIKKIVQVGIRDFCEDEFQYTQNRSDLFQVFFDHQLTEKKMTGVNFKKIADEIISSLPDRVWVSFDIDGLDPKYCPHTGTPVPGGLDYSEAVQILRTLAKSGRKIIGFDVVEVAPTLNSEGKPIEVIQASNEWDANVGMRLIYKLSAFALVSQNFCKWNHLD